MDVLCRVQVKASLIVVLTRGGSTARLVAKYKPSIPVLTVAVPVLTTDSLTWTCSGEQPARQCLITRGLLPLLAEGSARATDTDTTDEIIAVGRASVYTLRLLNSLFCAWSKADAERDSDWNNHHRVDSLCTMHSHGHIAQSPGCWPLFAE